MTTGSKHSPRFLIVGYGNTLRGDDGVGPLVVEAIERLKLAEVETLVCALLTPELADPVSGVRTVVFVDASVDSPREVQFRRLEPAESSQLMAHAADPRTLLAMARDVFGHAPEAHWLTIPVEQLGFTEDLSPLAKTGIETAIRLLRELIESPSGSPTPANESDSSSGERL